MWVHEPCLASMWILRIWTRGLLQVQQILQLMEPSSEDLATNFYTDLFKHMKTAGRLGSWLDSWIKGQPQNQRVYESFLLVLHKPQLCHLFPALSLSVFLPLPLPLPFPCLFQPFTVHLSVFRVCLDLCREPREGLIRDLARSLSWSRGDMQASTIMESSLGSLWSSRHRIDSVG